MYEQQLGLDSPIFLYIRNSKNQKKGLILAGVDIFGKVCIGWSLCNNKDKFYPETGLDIAVGRLFANDRLHANYCHEESIKCLEEIVPQTVMKSMDHFLTKMKKYYKKGNFSDIVIYLMASKSNSFKG